MSDKKIYNLSNVTKAIENVINTHCNKTIWVRAEIVKLNYYNQSGHAYPDLVEKKDGKILAEIRGNIWSSNFEQINKKFKSVLNEELGDNMTIVCLATVKYNSLYGLSLNITDIDPSYTLGELAKQKAETIKRLKEEKLYTLNKDKLIPILPKTIAIVSVETSKGYCDFINVLKSNPWSYKFHYLLFPAVLQGDRAINSILSQLEKIKKYSDSFDVIVLIRGGGGDIGLSCYDDYTLAKAIATFPIPVLSGIGHSTNETVTELVSFKSFITPTKVAEFLLQQYHNFSVPIKENIVVINNFIKSLFDKQSSSLRESARLFKSITNRLIDNQKHNISNNSQSILSFNQRIFLSSKQNLRNNANVMQLSTSNYILGQNHNLFNLISSLKSNMDSIKINQQNTLLDIKKYVLMNCKTLLEKSNIDIHNTQTKISLLSPESTLKRGYSITRINGKSINNPSFLKINDKIETEVFEGKIISRVEEIENKKTKLPWLKK
ncbi:MAG: exodeoxyribonuclease VII large subunit [Clostridiaceae bacterium]|nr:exodeoxyribonuclease VII large subunit [Clostridiaceae bacterium]